MTKEYDKQNIGFKHAWQGIKWVVKNERNMQIHLTFALLAIGAGILLKVNPLESSLLAMVIALVLLAEMVNSALEQVVNLCVGTVFHTLAKRAKDIAAGAVLVVAINAVIVGLIIFLPKLIYLFYNYSVN